MSEATGIRFLRPTGETYRQMHENMQRSPLFVLGDCILVWVNEGDFWSANPVDVETDERDRKEYERLKAKFERGQTP